MNQQIGRLDSIWSGIIVWLVLIMVRCHWFHWGSFQWEKRILPIIWIRLNAIYTLTIKSFEGWGGTFNTFFKKISRTKNKFSHKFRIERFIYGSFPKWIFLLFYEFCMCAAAAAITFIAKSSYNALNIHTADEIINQFADVHELLGKAMVNVSS